ncbi:MAG: hypothetical protein H0T44_00735 [Gemmatimonadales bacterium]|nr:hypothetical protein [Gemmatimonadales bacterium]MDQ3428296.1 hypothetical protein [Gemmatimonadota bacterium]
MALRLARPAIILPLLLTAGLGAVRLVAVPTLSDPSGAPLPESLHLATPWVYLLLAPLFSLWDAASMLSMSRLRGFLLGLAILYGAWRCGRALLRRRRGNHRTLRQSVRRETLALALSLGALLLFLAGGALWHRPMLALAGADRNDIVADFHSHTNVSHDVQGTLMGGYDAAATLRWHRRAGFDAVFITDHNTMEGFRSTPGPPDLCPGIEVSAWRAHIVLLGATQPVDRNRYGGDLAGLLDLLRASESGYGALSVASIPEYERNHWGRLDTLIAAGLDGFEVANAAPKANEISRERRDSVIALARRTGRFVVGVSDHHGWGATSMVWNLVRAPRWREGARGACPTVLARLRTGFAAVRVVERHRLRPDAWWPAWLTPVGMVWESWRSMGSALTLSWFLWIWVVASIRVLAGPRGRE